MTAALLAAALDEVDRPTVGDKLLTATLTRLSWQAARVGGGEGRRAA